MTDIETGEAADLMNSVVNCSKEVKSELQDLLVPIVKKEMFDLDSDVEKETVGSNLDVLHLEESSLSE